MKRIVQCPKCQAKLSVFDSGKPIKQKCPKCGENFVVESEEAKAVDAKKEPDAAAVAAPVIAEAKPDVKADAKPEAKADAKPETKAEAKETLSPKPASKPTLPNPVVPTLPATDIHEHHSGVSFQHIAVIVVLLIIVIVMQFKSMYYSARRFDAIEDMVSKIHK